MLTINNMSTNFVKSVFTQSQNSRNCLSLNSPTKQKKDVFERNTSNINFGAGRIRNINELLKIAPEDWTEDEKDMYIFEYQKLTGERYSSASEDDILQGIFGTQDSYARQRENDFNKTQSQANDPSKQMRLEWKNKLKDAAYNSNDKSFSFNPDELAKELTALRLATDARNRENTNLRRSLFPFIVEIISSEIKYSDSDFTDVIDQFTTLYKQPSSRPGKNNGNLYRYLLQLQTIKQNYEVYDEISGEIAMNLDKIIKDMRNNYDGDCLFFDLMDE